MTSNAVAGTESMTTIVFDHNLLPLVVSLLQSSCSKAVVGSLRVIINLVGYISDEQKWGLLKHDKHGVLSTVLPLLSTELSKPTPSEEIIITLCNIFVDILEFISNTSSEEHDASDLHAMFKNEMKKDVYSQLDDEKRYYRYDIDRVVSLLKDMDKDAEEDADKDADKDTDEDADKDTDEDADEDVDEDGLG